MKEVATEFLHNTLKHILVHTVTYYGIEHNPDGIGFVRET